MTTAASTLVLDPLRVFSLELPALESPLRRGTLRTLLALSAGAVRVDGVERLAAAPEPSIFALSHHNAWEALLAPAALVALRRGRLVRFFVDWMFVDLPWTGWLVRQLEPIPVYAKRARFGLRDAHRLRRLEGLSPVDLAVAALDAGDDVGVYPEGKRNPHPHILLRGRSGLGVVALRSGAPVVPVGIDFDARDRLGRTPKVGRFALAVGEPLDFPAERAAWLAASAAERPALERRLARGVVDRVQAELARRARKVYLPRPGAGSQTASPATSRSTSPAATAGDGPTAERVADEATRAAALAVLGEVYGDEKGWLASVEHEIPLDPAADPAQSWFVARAGGEPAGTLRLAYDPPLALPAEAEVELDPGVDLEALARSGRFVEIGRLTIRPRFRGKPAVVLALVQAAIREVDNRGYDHLLTAVFEDDPHSPLGFHTRVLGFERIGTHRKGELRCASRRILLVLDLAKARARVASRGGRVLARLVGAGAAPARAAVAAS
jgi:1-acyl-sn-glycerol-3-phosphate acyltransferase